MIRIRRSTDRGHADHGWVDSHHTFSFAEYYDPDHMGYGPLRVINQDRVQAGKGFGTHGHKDMEIVSYVLDGVLEHKDSMGNGSQMRPGEVQIMSAGSGVRHSEFNASKSDTLHFLQMWVFPRELGTAPRYEQKAFPKNERRGKLRLVISPDGDQGSLTIGQDANLHVGLLGPADRIVHPLPKGRAGWIHVASGTIRVEDQELGSGDGAAIEGMTSLTLEGVQDAEIVLWDFPAP